MEKNCKKLVLFDVDGTLLLGMGAHDDAFRQGFKNAFKIDIDISNTKGTTDKLRIHRMFDQANVEKTPENIEKMKLAMIENFQKQDISNTLILPGVKELLEKLSQDKNILIGLGTGNVKEIAYTKLKYLNLHNYFEKGGFGGDYHIRSEMIAAAIKEFEDKYGEFLRSNIFIIGDTIHDIRAAKDNGAKVIAVLTGKKKKEDLEKEKPDYIFEDLANTEKIIGVIKK